MMDRLAPGQDDLGGAMDVTPPPLVQNTRARKPAPHDCADDTLVTVSDLARDLGITVRTLRFYEDKGLIAPRRVGSTRAYSHRDRARMIIILRGKRLGFSLREIREFLDLYDADPKQVTQMRALLTGIGERRRQLEDKRDAIDEALRGLVELEDVAVAILGKAASRRDKNQKSPI